MDHASPQAPSFVVGIGASAGGLEVLEVLFDHLPADTGMAFVVVQHLSPDFRSLMDELLARHTWMNIQRVEQAVQLDANCVYLIPPKHYLEVNDEGWLVPIKANEHVPVRLPVDHFLTSLGERFGDRSVAVILSGTGSDGSRGARLLKQNGGTVIAQSPESCRFDGMPKSVIETGCVDRIEPPRQISALLQDLARHNSITDEEEFNENDFEHLPKVFALLEASSGINFHGYRHSTIMRRIQRRMAVHGVGSLVAYTKLLAGNEDEIELLSNELLIGVTRFFRDEDAWAVMQDKVIPEIVAELEENEPIRCWVAGCSTGEEAYTLAMLFMEHFDQHAQQHDLKVFATDVDQRAIQFASTNLYPETVIADIGPIRVKRFFHKVSGGFSAKPAIRRSIIFSQHNCLSDPPFTRLHLVICRNLLIYFRPELQRKAISMFHFCLKPKGYLFLGKSESLSDLSHAFTTIASTEKVFKKLNDGRISVSRPQEGQTSMPVDGKSVMTASLHAAKALAASELGAPRYAELENQAAFPMSDQRIAPMRKEDQPKVTKVDQLYEYLLQEFVPPCILVDPSLNLLHVFGEGGNFLSVPTGKSTFNVQKMVDRSLGLTIGAAVVKAKKHGEVVVFQGVRVTYQDEARVCDIRVRSLSETGRWAEAYLIFFEKLRPLGPSNDIQGDDDVIVLDSKAEALSEVDSASESVGETVKQSSEKTSTDDSPILVQVDEEETLREGLTFDAREYAEMRIANLEEQLAITRESLQASIEELETTNEELQSTNEELMSANEELQSSNEELQSVNEELQTVNAEYQSKIRELVQANADIELLLSLSNIGVIILDKDLRIRRYNKDVQKAINIVPHDISRRISDLTFQVGHEDIMEMIHMAMHKRTLFSKTYTLNHRQYSIKVMPYFAEDDYAKGQKPIVGESAVADERGLVGILLCILDLTALLEAEKI